MSDSLMLEATGEGVDRLEAILSLCSWWTGEAPTFSGWHKNNGSIELCRFCSGNFTAFPTELPAEQAAPIVDKHLENLPDEMWPREPDIDGSCKRGWKITADNDSVIIEPFWMIYHK